MKKSKPKVKEKKKDEETFDYMKTNKDNLNNILRDDKLLPIINDITIIYIFVISGFIVTGCFNKKFYFCK